MNMCLFPTAKWALGRLNFMPKHEGLTHYSKASNRYYRKVGDGYETLFGDYWVEVTDVNESELISIPELQTLAAPYL